MIALDPHLPRKRTRQLPITRGILRVRPGETNTLELHLDEELRVEDGGRGVERRAGDGGVDVVGGRDGVRGEERNDFGGGEAGVAHSAEDLGDAVEGLGDEQVGGGFHRGWAACDEEKWLGCWVPR